MKFTTNPTIQIDAMIQNSQLWVRNTTHPRRVLLMAVIDRAGRMTSHPIPDTPHPIFLSNDLTPDTLSTCTDLRKFVSSGALAVVLPDEAETYYKSNPRAIEALKRAYDKVSNRNDPVSREALSAADPQGRMSADEDDAAQQPEADVVGSRVDSQGVNMMVRGIVGNFSAGVLTAKAAIADLDNITLTESDLMYISKNAKGALAEWGKKTLAERRAA